MSIPRRLRHFHRLSRARFRQPNPSHAMRSLQASLPQHEAKSAKRQSMPDCFGRIDRAARESSWRAPSNRSTPKENYALTAPRIAHRKDRLACMARGNERHRLHLRLRCETSTVDFQSEGDRHAKDFSTRMGIERGDVAKRRYGERCGSMGDRKSTRLNSSHIPLSRMPSSA